MKRMYGYALVCTVQYNVNKRELDVHFMNGLLKKLTDVIALWSKQI